MPQNCSTYYNKHATADIPKMMSGNPISIQFNIVVVKISHFTSVDIILNGKILA